MAGQGSQPAPSVLGVRMDGQTALILLVIALGALAGLGFVAGFRGAQ